MKIRWNPELSFGAVMQAVVVVVTIGGSVLGAYLALNREIDADRAEFRVALATDGTQILEEQSEIADLRQTGNAFQIETRTALGRVLDAIGALKVDIAREDRGNHGGDRR